MSEMNILIYEGKSGTRVDLKSLDFETMWATVKQIAEIFDCTTQNVEYHAKRIFDTGELIQDSVTKKILVTASDGELNISVISKMEITASDGKKYNVEHYYSRLSE